MLIKIKHHCKKYRQHIDAYQMLLSEYAYKGLRTTTFHVFPEVNSE